MNEASQPGFAIWLTGLPSSGKSTLAHSLHNLLDEKGINVQILDSDDLRKVLTPDPTYSDQERDWFYHVLAYIAGLLAENGVNVIIAATAPKREHRQVARERIHRFIEVYLNCPEEVCRERDSKGLWKRAEAGEITNLPGAGAPYEAPQTPEIQVGTGRRPPQAAARHVFDRLRHLLSLN